MPYYNTLWCAGCSGGTLSAVKGVSILVTAPKYIRAAVLMLLAAAVLLPRAARAQTATAPMDRSVRVFAPFPLIPATAKTGTRFDFAGVRKPIVLVFLAKRCGVTWLYADRIASLQRQYPNITIVGVHSNTEESDRELTDELRVRHLSLPIIDDRAKQELASYFNARVTPYFVLIDARGVLRYKGPFDLMGGSVAESKRSQYLRPALESVLAGKPVTHKLVRALGCELPRRGISP